ncbi:unnamed protein product [Diatraea saccharalis]|uniref:Uncharacterized protein n=1 Tax=Diatraea saccharalis TaxID=40085 RepID=A0A9N9R1Z3_9NEOP|nr:unnamed protein product [Diatraea saccharalis]
MSKLQSKLKNLPPQPVLKPCDVEFSKSFKNVEEGVKVKLTVSEVEVHIAATTVHTVLDIVEEITTELTMPDEKELFNFATYLLKMEKQDEDLWSPKKLTHPYVMLNTEDSYVQPPYPSVKPSETLLVTIPSIKILLEIEHTERVPVLMMKLSSELTLHDWSRQLHGNASLTAAASCYNERLDVWEPLIEPVVINENTQRPWELTATIFQAKAYPMSSRLDTSSQPDTEDLSYSDHSKKAKKKNEFESETSADECDTDNEMTFIRNPNGRENKHYSVDFGAGNMPLLGALDIDESDSENENGLMDKLATAFGHIFNDDSSGDEASNDENSSAPEQTEAEVSDNEENDKAVSFTDGAHKSKKEVEHKTVTLQEPVREDSVDSGLETESFQERLCTYMILEARHALNITITPAGARALLALSTACTDRTIEATTMLEVKSIETANYF